MLFQKIERIFLSSQLLPIFTVLLGRWPTMVDGAITGFNFARVSVCARKLLASPFHLAGEGRLADVRAGSEIAIKWKTASPIQTRNRQNDWAAGPKKDEQKQTECRAAE